MLFFSRASRAGNVVLIQRAVGIASTIALFGCGIVGNSGSESAGKAGSRETLLSATQVDEAKILLNNVDPMLTLAGSKVNKDAKETDVSLPDCATVKKRKYNSAVFHHPNALRNSARDAQAIARRSGYFSNQAAAQKAVADSLSGKFAAGIICLDSSRYSAALKLNSPSWDGWNSTLIFSGTLGLGPGYSSKVSLLIQFGSKTVNAEIANVKGRFDYHYVSSMILRSTNGDEDIWNFAPSKAAEERIKGNLNDYLTQWTRNNPATKSNTKAGSAADDQENPLITCKTYKEAKLVAYVNVELQKVFPTVKNSEQQIKDKSGRDEKNYVFAELKMLGNTETKTTLEKNLDTFTLEQGKDIRTMKLFIRRHDAGRYELHLTPVVGGTKLTKSAVVKFTLRHGKNSETGLCAPILDDQSLENGENGLGAAVSYQ